MKKTGRVVDNRYFELVRHFPLKTLSSENEYDQAMEVVNSLVTRGFDNLTSGEDAYLDVLSDIVKKYENEHSPIPEASPVEVLQFFIEDRKTNQRAVALGSGIAVSTMSEILAGRRAMNLEHIRKVAKYFNVPLAVFLTKDGRTQEARQAESRKTTPRLPVAAAARKVPAKVAAKR